MDPTITAALIGLSGVIITLLVTKFDDIVSLFKKSPRDISGIWEVLSYEISYGAYIVDEPPHIKHEPTLLSKSIVTIKQRGIKFEGAMKETDVFQEGVRKVRYKWTGKIINDHIVYESVCEEQEAAMRSTAMLFIDARGQKMNGYFVATSGGQKAPLRTWVGYAILTKKG